jgi:hypothetical protein
MDRFRILTGVTCSARKWFSGVVMPLLATLSEYTGYDLTLLAGRVSTDPDVDIQLVG